MKTIFALCALCVLCGCNRPDPRIAKLEARIAGLENEVRTNVTDLLERNQFRKDAISNIIEIVKDMNSELSDHQVVLNELKTDGLPILYQLRDSLTNQPKRANYYAPTPAAKPTPAMKSGIPLDIYNAIAADARRRYPVDFDMQVFIINQQVEAYKKLHP